MARLTRAPSGAFKARKRLPRDVGDEYARQFGPRLEAKFSLPASTPTAVAQQRYGEWLAEVLGRIKAIRAQQMGVGVSLTGRQTRALAGEWYDWFIARHPLGELRKWAGLRDQVQDALREASGDENWNANNPDDLWRDDEALRKAVRPLLADIGETAQFLGAKSTVLDRETRDRFLDFLYNDLAAAFSRLITVAPDDFSPDKYRERFPKFEGGDDGTTPLVLFEKWVAEREPAASTVESWQYVFTAMRDYFKDRSAASITEAEAQEWALSLKTSERSARTVANTYITACRTVFGWALKHKHIPRNSFAGVLITVPKQRQLRETKAFRSQEYQIILKATLKVIKSKSPDGAAQRWVPWLCAYTGARAGEVTQLRGSDVINRDGIHAIHINPDAGTVKGGQARSVPLHEHLIAQGFLKFVEGSGNGPLFYRPSKKIPSSATKRTKPRSTQTRQRLADWVRKLGVTDPEVQPNHAWRHTFKQIADRAKISERMSNYITGHAHKSVGAKYGAPTLEDMAQALKDFPRYVV